MKHIYSNPIILGFIVLLLIFAGSMYALDVSSRLTSTNAIRLSVAAAVFIAWVPFALAYIWDGRPPRHGYLVIGICCHWLADAALATIYVTRSFYTEPYPWYLSPDAIVLAILVSVGGGLLQLTSGTMSTDDTSVPTRGWVLAGVTVAFGLLISVFLIALGTRIFLPM